MKQFMLRLDDDAHRGVKTKAADLGLTMQEYINALIETELKKLKYIKRDYIPDITNAD